MIVRRIGVLSAAKLGGFIGLLCGLVVGLLITLAYVAGGPAQQAITAPDAPAGFISHLGALAVIAVPLAHTIAGALMAAAYALIYNVAAWFTGGVEFELR